MYHTGQHTIDGEFCMRAIFTLWFYILINSHEGLALRIDGARRKTQFLAKSATENHPTNLPQASFLHLRPEAIKMSRTNNTSLYVEKLWEGIIEAKISDIPYYYFF